MRPPPTPADAGHPQSDAGAAPDAAAPTAATPATGPLALWLLVQLAAVALAVLRVPLAARYPEPAERRAAHLVLATQVIAAGLLLPLLFRDRRTAVAVVASAWPFQLAAGYLAGMPPAALAWPAAFVTAWLAALACGAAQLRTPRAQAIGITIATLLALGGGVLRYLRLEFGRGVPEGTFTPESVSPLLSTLAAIEGSSTRTGWVLIATLLGSAALGAAARKILARTRHASPPATAL